MDRKSEYALSLHKSGLFDVNNLHQGQRNRREETREGFHCHDWLVFEILRAVRPCQVNFIQHGIITTYVYIMWSLAYSSFRHGLHGEASSADLAQHETRLGEIQNVLEQYPPERIFNMDETGLFYKARPNHLYMSRAAATKDVKGHKETQAKDRVTLVLATNATGKRAVSLRFSINI